ncbi:MAG: DUF7901 domain-containing protein, partial [Planctomycetota bacterium]
MEKSRMKVMLVCALILLAGVTYAEGSPESYISFVSSGGGGVGALDAGLDCPANTLFGQVVHDPCDNWATYASDANIPQLVYENFWGVNGPICDIHFWGLDLYLDPILGTIECDEDPMTFEIKFYEDDACSPGAVVCSYIVTPQRTDTGLDYWQWRLFEYSTDLEPCCNLASGWVSIQGVSEPNDCWFWWMNSGTGDGLSYLSTTGSPFSIIDDWSLCLTGGGDDCGNPVPVMLGVGDLPYSNTNTTCGRGDDYNDTCLGGADNSEDIIYELTVTESMVVNITIDPCGSNMVGLALDDSCPPDGSCIKYHVDTTGIPYGFCVHLEPGTYYIMIDRTALGCIPEFTLTIEQGTAPGNDDCANAEAVGEVVDEPFDTTCASFDGSGSCMTSPNIWYLYTASCTGQATVSLCGSDYDTMLAVYDGNTCPPGTEIDCNDDTYSCPIGNNYQSQITFSAVAGNEYLIEVGGYYQHVGQGLLSISCVEVCERGDYINPGQDLWTCPDSNFVFGTGGGCLPAIPADFFEPGSDPFEGQVACVGEDPFIDAVIERTSQGHVPPPFPSADAIDIELVELHLRSVAPIVVNTFGNPELWDVEVDVSPGFPSVGTLHARKEHCNGGTYTANLSVQPRFTFTKLSDPGEIRVLDTGLEGITPFDLNSVGSCPWENTPECNDFRPESSCPLTLEDTVGCSMTLIASEMVRDTCWANVDATGGLQGGGSGYGDGQWYYYQNTDWWNQWFYDHAFDPNRKKVIDVTVWIRALDPCEPSLVRIAYNWATPDWPDANNPPLPPLDPAEEALYIGRKWFLSTDLSLGSSQGFEARYEIEDYNPAWISIDVNGFNYELFDVQIDHACVAKDTPSYEPKPAVANLKWSQPPIEIDPNSLIPTFCGWDEVSYNRNQDESWKIVADDFRCFGTMPITSIHWWGSYFDWEYPWGQGLFPNELPIAWKIGFWSNVPAGVIAEYSYPKTLLWQIDLPAERVEVEEVGKDDFGGWYPYDICYQYYVDLGPDEIFWQDDFLGQTMDDVFWLSIAAVYPDDPCDPPYNPWGWKTRPWSWMDDAVTFNLAVAPDEGIDLDPVLVTPIEDPIWGESYDVAFELDTAAEYVKWEQPFSGIRHWPHYEDEESMAFEDIDGTVNLTRLVADDWLCSAVTPITAATWWGSYIGYTYGACQDLPTMYPVKPDYFLLSIWTDVPDPDPCDPAFYSHPGELVWEYKAFDYDEVLVGYDKHPEQQSGPPREPVFRYSLRIPDDEQFCQEYPDTVYWFSVVAVYMEGNDPAWPWGWTNHEHFFNDDAVAGYFDAASGWTWQELYDQTGESEDMSFILYTEPEECCPCYGDVVGNTSPAPDGIVNSADLAAFMGLL